jgi:hypothetical protein
MSYVALATTTLSSATSSVTFGSIPATFKDLVLVANGSTASGAENILLRFNSDTGSNYSSVFMLGSGSSALSGTVSSTSIFGGGFGATRANALWQIMDYSATDKHKTTLNRTDRADDAAYAWAGRWANTSAITTIQVRLGGALSFAAGTTISLYGIA